MALAIFLFFVIQAQSEEASDTATTTEVSELTTTENTESVQVNFTATTTEVVVISEESTQTATSTAELLAAASSTPGTLESSPTNPAPTQSSPQLENNALLSTASSSPSASSSPVEIPQIVKEFVLQPSVNLHIKDDTVSAQILIQNLSCRSCAKPPLSTEVITYYTPWYPNDGEIKEIGSRMGETAISISNLPNWGEHKAEWSGEVPPGHYYFVVTIDPNNLNNLYSMYRLEFKISL